MLHGPGEGTPPPRGRAETEPHLHGQGGVGGRSPPPAPTQAPKAANPWGFRRLKGSWSPIPLFWRAQEDLHLGGSARALPSSAPRPSPSLAAREGPLVSAVLSAPSASALVPQHPDEGRDAAGLEDGEQALAVVREVVQDAGGAAGRVQVAGALHGAHHGRHDLGRLHQGAARRLLLGELVDDHGRFADNHLGGGEREKPAGGRGSRCCPSRQGQEGSHSAGQELVHGCHASCRAGRRWSQHSSAIFNNPYPWCSRGCSWSHSLGPWSWSHGRIRGAQGRDRAGGAGAPRAGKKRSVPVQGWGRRAVSQQPGQA